MEATADHGLNPEAVTLAQHNAKQRHGQTGPRHEHPGDMAHDRRLLSLRLHHEAGRIAQRYDRNIKSIAKLHESPGLVPSLGIDRATEMPWIVGYQSERLALDANEGGDHSDTEIPTYFEHRSLVSQKIDDVTDIVNP